MSFFSIIIPTYNRARFLSNTIRSVVNQTFSDFEVLVVDDGSTDNTSTVIGDLAEKDHRIIYLHKQNGERGAARNYGLAKAKGKYVVFLDSDDLLKPEHLYHLHFLIQQHPKICFFATKFDFLDQETLTDAPISRLSEGVYDYRLLLKGNPFACNVCVKRENLSLIYFPEDRNYSGMEDWIFIFSNLWSQDLFLSDCITSTMTEHPDRSMRFNKIITEKRKNALSYLLRNFSLTASEKTTLKGYSYYFCAIHAYLDFDRKNSLLYILKASINLGPRKDLFTLIIKVLFGRKMIGKIKEVINHS